MKKPVRNSDIIWRTETRKETAVLEALERGEVVDEHGTVTLIISGMMHQLNLIGGMIWKLCDGEHSIDDIVEVLAAEFDAEHDELSGDVQVFVDGLAEKGWLKYE